MHWRENYTAQQKIDLENHLIQVDRFHHQEDNRNQTTLENTPLPFEFSAIERQTFVVVDHNVTKEYFSDQKSFTKKRETIVRG